MKQHSSKIIVTAILATAASLLFVSTAQAKPTPSFTPVYGNNATYMNALHVRSQALNAKYSPTNALLLRSEALNAKYGLGNFAQKPATSAATEATGGMDVRQGLIGGTALFATILVVGAAIVLTQRRQTRPLGV